MRVRGRAAAGLRYGAAGLALITIWTAATTLSGFSVLQTDVFAGPVFVLAISAGWMAHGRRAAFD